MINSYTDIKRCRELALQLLTEEKTGADLIRESNGKLPRTKVYVALNQLIERGLVKRRTVGNIKRYRLA